MPDKTTKRIAAALGAQIVGTVPDVGPGWFGAERLSRVVAELKRRMKPGKGRRPGRPTNAKWSRHPKVPMSEATERKLRALARRASSGERSISPMQLAAQILENALTNCEEN